MTNDKYKYELYLTTTVIAVFTFIGMTVKTSLFHNPYITPVLIPGAIFIARNKDVNSTIAITAITIVGSAFVAQTQDADMLTLDFNSPLLWATPKIISLLVSYYLVNSLRLNKVLNNKEVNNLSITIFNVIFVLALSSLLVVLAILFTPTHFGY